MESITVMATEEELNTPYENPERRLWHAVDETGQAACGIRGIWGGAGFIVTCEGCAAKVGTDPKHFTIGPAVEPKPAKIKHKRPKIGHQRKWSMR